MMKRGQTKSASGHHGAAFGTGFGGFGGFGGHFSASSLSYLTEPPSFAAISDPNVVVSLKNVLKKDATTKTKALDELIAYAQANPHDKGGGVEDGVLHVWIQLYPRASIDNARRVREQSHHLQLELIKSARKRMERHIPKVVGAWVAGFYDRDRAVSRAASDGLGSFLTSPEKADAFWKKCQSQILDFALEAIQETQDSLSDERSTSKEDAEAKYCRVVHASISLVVRLLQQMDDSDIDRCRSSLDEYFATGSVWTAISNSDSSVRRRTCQLLLLCLDRQLPYADTEECRQAMTTDALETPQTASANQVVAALSKLTKAHPDIWETKKKKSPVARLTKFIAKGSQGSQASFWESLDSLLSLLPRQSASLDSELKLLNSIRSGIEHKLEPRTNASVAWACFSTSAKRAIQSLSEIDAASLTKSCIFPLFDEYLFPKEGCRSTVSSPTLGDIYAHLANSNPTIVSATEDLLANLGTNLCTNLSASLPGVSKEYHASQEKVGGEGRRWFQLAKEISQRSKIMGLTDQMAPPSLDIISQCISLLESRNMKPFGAATVIEQAMRSAPQLFIGDTAVRISNFLLAAAEDHMQHLVEAPSTPTLLSCLSLSSSIENLNGFYKTNWGAWVKQTLALAPGEKKNEVLANLISQKAARELVLASQPLQDEVIKQAIGAAHGSDGSKVVLSAAMDSGTITTHNQFTIAQAAIDALDQQPSEHALDTLAIIVKSNSQLLTENEELHTSLLAVLLGLSELQEKSGVAEKAASIRSLLSQQADGKLPVVGIIQSNLERAGPSSLDIETLAKLAGESDSTNVPLEDLFPSSNVWMTQLKPFFELPISPIVSMSSPIGGATSLSIPSATPSNEAVRVPRDSLGRSIPARMAIYLSLMMGENVELSRLPTQFQVELLYLQCITVQIVSDQITLMETNGLWFSMEEEENMREAHDVIKSLRTFLNRLTAAKEWWLEDNDNPETEILRSLSDLLIQQSRSLSSLAIYSARAFSELVQATAESHGLPSSLGEKFIKADLLKSTPDIVLVSAAILAGFGEHLQASKQINNFFNRLVSDVAEASVAGKSTKSILSLLTLCSKLYESGRLPVANQRIVIAVRQITRWMDEPEHLDAHISTEICRVLAYLLPCMKDVYGSYWENTVTFCLSIWNKAPEYELEQALPLIHASLKIARIVETLPEPNDDLEEALEDLRGAKPVALLELLKLLRDVEAPAAEIVTFVLSQEVEKIALRQIPALVNIYPLVAAESRNVQTAAYGLLHRAIPVEQEQASVDVLLDKIDARLPEELLSLLLNAPALVNYLDADLAQFPLAVRRYLLSWKLVYDAFSGASFKVRTDFTKDLRTGDYVGPLLDFVSGVFGHSAARAINLDQHGLLTEQILHYDINVADSEGEKKSMYWLLAHLYYLVLKYTPGLFRGWYTDCRSKQTRIAVEAWTSKYYSPLIIGENLDEVQRWADSQEPAGADEQELQVKVSRVGREVTAGYEVDESQAAIAIKVPASYPIESVAVQSVNRVAVSERMWQSWILTTQGVITFSNGNIVDGLQVFKRNIVGALKGQVECAICYSIISTDRRMPDKRCTTCKNMFHRTCLYKWFQSSNQNTCPLCRNPIDYLGADTAKRR